MLVVAAGPEFKLLATNATGESLMATPALSDGVMYVRTARSLFAVFGHRVRPWRRAARGLADDQPFAEAVQHLARRRATAGEMDDAAEHPGKRQCGLYRAVGVDARKAPRVAGKPRCELGRPQEPPRYAVHCRQHDGAFADQRGERRRLK